MKVCLSKLMNRVSLIKVIALIGALTWLTGCAQESNHHRLLQSNQSSNLEFGPPQQPIDPPVGPVDPIKESPLAGFSVQAISAEVERYEANYARLSALALNQNSIAGDFAELQRLEQAVAVHRAQEAADGKYRSMDKIVSQIIEGLRSMESRAQQANSAYNVLGQLGLIPKLVLEQGRALDRLEFEINQRAHLDPAVAQIKLAEAAALRARMQNLVEQVDFTKDHVFSQLERTAESLKAHRNLVGLVYAHRVLSFGACGLLNSNCRVRRDAIKAEQREKLALYDKAIKQAENFISRNTLVFSF